MFDKNQLAFRNNENLTSKNYSELVTEEEYRFRVNEMIKCSQDITYFAEKYYTIVSLKVGKTIIKMYPKQQQLLELVTKNTRVICSASRQSGKTTTVGIFACHFVCFNPDKKILILANKESIAKEFLARIKQGFELLPKWLKPGIEEWNQTSVKFTNGSGIEVSATSSDAARGKSCNVLVIDEAAIIDQKLMSELWASVYPIVSSDINSKVILISTPKGNSGMFYEIYQKSLMPSHVNEEGWKSITIGWQDVPGRDKKWYDQTMASLNYDETVFKQEFDNCVTGDTLITLYDTVEKREIKLTIAQAFQILKQSSFCY